MDVADLLVQPPESEAWANALIGGGFSLFILCFAVAFATAWTKRKVVRGNVAAGLIAALAIASIATGTSLDSRYSPPRYDKVLESRLFEDYGFTSEDLAWHRVERGGPDGYIATMKRDGDKFTVKVTLEGSRLSLVGTDGQEIPARNQTTESSK